MYEFLVLGRLAHCPMHGYMIAKIIGDIIGPVRQLQWGALYPLLSRLERDGLIRGEAPAAGRTRKVYAITDAGRERLHHLLLDTTHHRGEYDSLFAHKVVLFPLLTPAERLFLARDYAVYTQLHIDHLGRERLDLEGPVGMARLSADKQRSILAVMDHRLEYWRREQAWAESLIAEQNRIVAESNQKEAV